MEPLLAGCQRDVNRPILDGRMDQKKRWKPTVKPLDIKCNSILINLSFRMRKSISFFLKKTFAGFQVLWPTSTIIINHPHQPPIDEHEQN